MFAVAAAVALLYAVLIGPEILRAVPEDDLFWMFPAMAEWGRMGSGWDRLLFLFSPAPINLGQPALKLYLSLETLCGWSMSALLVLAVFFHALNALLIAWLGREMGLSRRVSASAGLVTFSSFALFHATLWPTAVQHVLGLTTLLALLCLYLSVERRIRHHRPWRAMQGAALGVAVLGSLQRSVWMAWPLLLLQIGVSGAEPADRVRRFDRWLPLWVTGSIYPIVLMAGVGDIIVGREWAQLPGGWPVRMAGLGLAAAAGLVVIRGLLGRRIGAWAGTAAAILFWLFLLGQDRRQILLPYNLLVPLSTALASVLDPIGAALQIDSAAPYHYLRPETAAWLLLASAAVWLSFIQVCIRRRPSGLLLLGWFLICFIHLSHHYTSFPPRIPSRYFMYLIPLFSLVVCSVAIPWFHRLGAAAGFSRRWRWKIAGAFLALSCAANLAAVRLESFRGRLVNTYLSYDDVRTLAVLREAVGGSPSKVQVRGVVPMPFEELWRDYGIPRLAPYAAFDLLADDRFPPGTVRAVEDPSPEDGAVVFQIRGVRLIGPDGESAEPFWRLWAEERYRPALEERPFLLRYLLGGCRLTDVRWMTGGLGLRDWIGRVEGEWRQWTSAPVPKWERTRAVMEAELGAYAGCLVGLSVEAAEAGREEEARRWMWQLHLLEPDGGRLQEWLMGQEWMRDRPQWQRHLERVREPRWFQDPLPWTKDDYGFGRFLLRLLLNIDVQSRWERGQPRRRPLFRLF